MDEWLRLTRALSATMAREAPGWTERSDHDPGLTALDLLAFLAEGLGPFLGPADRAPASAHLAVGPDEGAEARAAPAADALVVVGGRPWSRVRSLAEAGADDPVFTVDAPTGEVTFGDGVHGRRPPDGATVVVHYRTGSGRPDAAPGGAERADDGREARAVTVVTRWPPPRRVPVVRGGGGDSPS